MTPEAEGAIVFECRGDRLLGILYPGARGLRKLGVLLVVGGPQYRIGSHRQFVLMSRTLAAAGYPVLRFDYRGMGDSDGEVRAFDEVDEDIRAAVDAFTSEIPGLAGIVIFGLCDGASAAMMYSAKDQRVRGMILANPWVRSETGEARAYLRYYYVQRLLQPEFWRKVFQGQFDVAGSVRDLLSKIRRSRGNHQAIEAGPGFVQRMARGFSAFEGRVLFLMSDNDLTAREFSDLCVASQSWRQLLARPQVQVQHLPMADHTFSSGDALGRAVQACTGWLEGVLRSVG